MPEAAEAGITAAINLSGGQACSAIAIVQFLRPFAGVPLRAEVWHSPPDLVAVNAVAALVRPTIGGIFDAASGDGVSNNRSQVADPEILFCPANVKNLVVNGILRCFEDAHSRRDNVANMHDGTPRRAVAFYIDLALRIGRGHQVIQDHIKP